MSNVMSTKEKIVETFNIISQCHKRQKSYDEGLALAKEYFESDREADLFCGSIRAVVTSGYKIKIEQALESDIKYYIRYRVSKKGTEDEIFVARFSKGNDNKVSEHEIYNETNKE